MKRASAIKVVPSFTGLTGKKLLAGKTFFFVNSNFFLLFYRNFQHRRSCKPTNKKKGLCGMNYNINISSSLPFSNPTAHKVDSLTNNTRNAFIMDRLRLNTRKRCGTSCPSLFQTPVVPTSKIQLAPAQESLLKRILCIVKVVTGYVTSVIAYHYNISSNEAINSL
jgi:hypothetical protein